VNDLVKVPKETRRRVTAVAMAPLVRFEAKERNRRIEERLNRSREKQKHSPLENA
jgi:hypothetical protein